MALRLHLWWDRCIYSWHQWLDLKYHLQWDPFAGPRPLEGDTSGGDYTFGAGKCGPGHLWVATCLKVFQENWGKLTVSVCWGKQLARFQHLQGHADVALRRAQQRLASALAAANPSRTAMELQCVAVRYPNRAEVTWVIQMWEGNIKWR